MVEQKGWTRHGGSKTWWNTDRVDHRYGGTDIGGTHTRWNRHGGTHTLDQTGWTRDMVEHRQGAPETRGNTDRVEQTRLTRQGGPETCGNRHDGPDMVEHRQVEHRAVRYPGKIGGRQEPGAVFPSEMLASNDHYIRHGDTVSSTFISYRHTTPEHGERSLLFGLKLCDLVSRMVIMKGPPQTNLRPNA